MHEVHEENPPSFGVINELLVIWNLPIRRRQIFGWLSHLSPIYVGIGRIDFDLNQVQACEMFMNRSAGSLKLRTR